MEIKEIHDNLQTARELAVIDTSRIEMRLRAGMEGKVRAAQAELSNLERLYKNTVVKSSVIIALTGKYAKDFAEIAEGKFKTVSLDYLHVVDEIAKSILHRGGQDSYTSREHFMAMDELNKVKMKYGILQLQVFQAKFDKVGPNTSIAEALYTELTAQYGGQLYSAVTRGNIAEKALEIGFTGKKLPVVLYNYSVPLDEGILPSPAVIVSVDKKPTENSVKDLLVSVRDSLK